jgi:hypothetical protein
MGVSKKSLLGGASSSLSRTVPRQVLLERMSDLEDVLSSHTQCTAQEETQVDYDW